MKTIGIIGGTGLEQLNLFQSTDEVEVSTPYGAPSSPFFRGMFDSNEVVICSRHGRDHTIYPSEINNLANIFALKELGCQFIIATTACGSLREHIRPGEIVIPDQLIDFTKHRKTSFFDHMQTGKLNHASMGEPFSKELRSLIIRCATELELSFHTSGTLLTIEGPRFSTRAESNMFRLFGADIINMSVAPEAALANEAGIPYAVIALSTDYDSWRAHENPVTWEEVIAVFTLNVKHVTQLLVEIIKRISD